MTVKLICFLLIGTVAMFFPIWFMSRRYQLVLWKSVVITVALTVAGTAGTFLMYFFENGRFGGLSFFGAVFVVPIVFCGIAPILRIPYGKIMDFCAVGECVMLALMKVHCMLGGCCVGRALFTTAAGTVVLFPSRTIEMITALLIFCVLLRWSTKGKKTGTLYCWYLLLYGSTRFVLNIGREAWVVKKMFMPYGNIWSLIAIVIGFIWLIVLQKRHDKAANKDEIY